MKEKIYIIFKNNEEEYDDYCRYSSGFCTYNTFG